MARGRALRAGISELFRCYDHDIYNIICKVCSTSQSRCGQSNLVSGSPDFVIREGSGKRVTNSFQVDHATDSRFSWRQTHSAEHLPCTPQQ